MLRENILEVRNLHAYFYTESGVAPAVEGLCFKIPKAQTLALVGESGCGKTVTALSILRLLPQPTGRIVQGEIIFQGQDLLKLPENKMCEVRGRQIGMIFQEPMSALNPLFSIGYQIQETLLVHQNISAVAARAEVLRLLNKVEMPLAQQRFNDYPHSLSGGLRQRAMIAQGLACQPLLLIADEPTTALDVTIQAQILELFSQLKQELKMSVLLITHDLGVVAQIADRVCIMYAGKIVEEADVVSLFANPRHPYTRKLLDSIPARVKAGRRLCAIPGNVPDPRQKPCGCAFHPRCSLADQRCCLHQPPFLRVDQDQWVSCWKA